MQAFFLQGMQRKLFAVFFPAEQSKDNKFILHIPAFAEEMNCARHIVSQQSRVFAEQGYSVLQIDLFGTGDSTGDFSEATWDSWKQDIESACQWLTAQGAESVTFWGLRLGALLAMECASHINLKVEKLILWQPVLFGEQFFMQFLRLKTVAAMMDSKLPAVKIGELKQQLLSGQFIEVAGYLLNPELMTVVMKLDASEINLPSGTEVVLISISSNNEPLSQKVLQFVDVMKSKQHKVIVRGVSGASFWVTHKSESLPQLNSVTLQCCL